MGGDGEGEGQQQLSAVSFNLIQGRSPCHNSNTPPPAILHVYLARGDRGRRGMEKHWLFEQGAEVLEEMLVRARRRAVVGRGCAALREARRGEGLEAVEGMFGSPADALRVPRHSGRLLLTARMPISECHFLPPSRCWWSRKLVMMFVLTDDDSTPPAQSSHAT